MWEVSHLIVPQKGARWSGGPYFDNRVGGLTDFVPPARPAMTDPGRFQSAAGMLDPWTAAGYGGASTTRKPMHPSWAPGSIPYRHHTRQCRSQLS